MLWLSTGTPLHYDTDLYHGQFIRWIEEYGVVKGLGNLHNRFGYNSAFFSLQALYSFKFLFGQSMHSLNCFAAVVFIIYAVSTLSIWKKQCLCISDFLKIGIVFYYANTFSALSSPNSDSMTLALVLYISAKWAELIEEKSKNDIKYGLLCLLAVWMVTLKLSAGFMILLAIYPAALLIINKRWKTVLGFLGAGIVIIVPFLVRNVLISGYLVYPFASLDLFDVDWKMPKEVVDMDKLLIMTWARGINQPDLFEVSFRQWFPIWYQNIAIGYKILFVVNIICMFFLIIAALSVWKRKTFSFPLAVLGFSGMFQLVMWFVSAPLIRYGSVYMLLLPAICLGILCFYMNIMRISYMSAMLVIIISLGIMVGYNVRYIGFTLEKPEDYSYRTCDEVVWEGLVMYVPHDDDRAGYHWFPSTTNIYQLASIELRGEDLADGFCMRGESCK